MWDLSWIAPGEGTYLPAVDADIARARELGIRGVPYFVFGGRFAVSGAQPVQVFSQALAEAASVTTIRH
jgi:predicted DsbA family dithiol-disulfide isomerase